MKVMILPIGIGAFGTLTGVLASWRTNGDHPIYSITENGQNTEKSSEDLRRLAITQTSLKNYQGVNDSNNYYLNYFELFTRRFAET